MRKNRLVIIIIITALVIALAGCTGATVKSLSGSGVQSYTPQRWKMTGSWNGYVSRTYKLTADNADTIYIESKNDSGTMTLLITQADQERSIDISDNYSGNIDLSGFEIGKVKVRLDIANAKGIELLITWR